MGAMGKGEGRGWSKGRNAANDPRIARAAAAHRGMTYTPRVPPERDRRRKSAPFVPAWTPTLAYAVGLLATDGCQTDGRHISFPSADRELVEILLRCLEKDNRISQERGRTGNVVYRTQIGDVAFCRWLEAIGIGPRKSLTIGPIDVPGALFLPFSRGLLDGDGSIINKKARADTKGRPGYRWEYLRTKFVSASLAHVTWLRDQLHLVARVDGYIEPRSATTLARVHTLRYGKRASLTLLPLLYADPTAPRLSRKWRVWADYAGRHGIITDAGKMDSPAQVAKPADAHV